MWFFLLLPSVVVANTIETVWYKPHWQCGSSDGSTPAQAAEFITSWLTSDTTDFMGLSEGETTAASLDYDLKAVGSIATQVDSGRPPSPSCTDVVPLPNATGSWSGDLWGPVCVDQVEPTAGDSSNCCSCTYSAEEYQTGSAENQNQGNRPWATGIFSSNDNSNKVCVVVAEFPHPLANQTLWDLNGQPPTDGSSYSIMRDVCTSQYDVTVCVPNADNTSVVFGTSVLVRGVTEFCQDLPLVLMANTNAGMGDFETSTLFRTAPLNWTQSGAPLVPYACCNDSFYGGGWNRYASDRIAVSGDALSIVTLQGGSTAPGGPLPEGLGYQCHAPEEHAPLCAVISFGGKTDHNESTGGESRSGSSSGSVAAVRHFSSGLGLLLALTLFAVV